MQKDYGKIAVTPGGVWNSENEYEKLVTVSRLGSSYMSIDDNKGVDPVEDCDPVTGIGTKWFRIAKKGDKGDMGTTDYNELENKPDLKTVATSGSYNDLTDKPTIPDELSDLTDDATHRLVTDNEKTQWGNKYDKPNSGIPESDLDSTTRGKIDAGATAYQKPASGIPASDIASGVIPDVSSFITKSVDDLVNYYLKSETYTKSEVQALIAAINQFHYEVYASTSEVTDPQSNVLYLIGPTGSGSDKYEEYVYPNSTKGWVKIGDTSIDLSGYVTTTALNTALANYTTTADLTTLLSGKVDKVQGKGLSTEDYTTEEKNKLGGIESGAQVNVLEGVQVDGSDLNIQGKKVNIDLSGKAEKSEMSVVAGTGANADKTTITLKNGTSATVLTTHQDISSKAEKSEMSITDGTGANADKTTIQLKSGLSKNVLIAHQDISGKEDTSNKVTTITDESTDTQYGSAKSVWTLFNSWLSGAMSWTAAQMKQARANLGFGNGDIDNVPTAGSDNLVKSGGVQNELALGAVYDVSAKNPTAGPNNDGKWESLNALLSDANLNTLIPTGVRKGGMSIKFVLSSDNKYVQFRYMGTSTAAADFTNVANWQGVDDMPIAGSDNLVKSDGVNEAIVPLQQEVFSFQRLEATLVSGYYFNNSGSFTQNSYFCYKYAFVNKGEVVGCQSKSGGAFGGIGIFKSLPSSSSVADKIINRNKATFIAPYDCYIVVTSESLKSATIFIGTYTEDEYNTLPICAEKVNAVRKSICTWHSEDGSLPGYINSSGVNSSTSSSWRILYIKVIKGDEIKFKGGVSGNYRAGYTDEEPTQGFTLNEIIPTDTTSPYIATRSGYFCISQEPAKVSLEANNYIIDVVSISQDVENIKDEIEVHSPEPLSPINKINGYYIKTDGSWQQLVNQQVKIYEITENNKYYIRSGATTNYALCAWFAGIPTTGSVPLLTIPYTEDTNRMQEAPTGANYLAISSYVVDYNNNRLDAFISSTVEKTTDELQDIVFINKYRNKKCLYIGDSISTSNNYQWKKLIEDAYRLNYVREKNGQLAPADGGITVRPPQEESQTLSQKSIWYRCAENRMSIYDFDVISLFGGTNDMTNSSLPIGTENDIPYVDDASGFDEGTVTDIRPETLTFASALMGCIKMLQRDFPNKEIIICTVMPCSGNYGNWTDPVTNLPASEAIANLQVRIANKYGLKAVPFYWNVRTTANSTNNTFSLDGVHPNLPCALRMRAAFAEILCL